MLHNLSFIEDPTRIFRAVRYENRYGFRMDEQTKSFARSCVEMHLVGDLSSVRLRDELIALLSEADVEWTLGRLFELGVAREVHPKLATGSEDRRAGGSGSTPWSRSWACATEVVTWRLRLTAMTRNMAHDELYLWLEQLKLKRSDSEVIREASGRGAAAADRCCRTTACPIGRSTAPCATYPSEALVFALGGHGRGIGRRAAAALPRPTYGTARIERER